MPLCSLCGGHSTPGTNADGCQDYLLDWESMGFGVGAKVNICMGLQLAVAHPLTGQGPICGPLGEMWHSLDCNDYHFKLFLF